MELSQEELKQALRYEEASGLFYWVQKKRGVLTGSVAGRISPVHGYVDIGINRKQYRAHRLAFLYILGRMPVDEVDHIDRCKSNNAWSNLRECTKDQNMLNILRSDNTSGVVGVSWDESRKRWLAQARVNGKKVNLGRYIDRTDAIKAWTAAVSIKNAEFRPL